MQKQDGGEAGAQRRGASLQSPHTPPSHALPLNLGSKSPSLVPIELTASLVLILVDLVFYCNLKPKEKGTKSKTLRKTKF